MTYSLQIPNSVQSLNADITALTPEQRTEFSERYKAAWPSDTDFELARISSRTTHRIKVRETLRACMNLILENVYGSDAANKIEMPVTKDLVWDAVLQLERAEHNLTRILKVEIGKKSRPKLGTKP